jgi:hypothetical protein
MRLHFLALVITCCSCTSPPAKPQIAAGVSGSIVREMRRLSIVDCPTPPSVPVSSEWSYFPALCGEVVAIDSRLLVVRMIDPSEWSSDVARSLMEVSAPTWGAGTKGQAIVLGRVDDALICRFFPSVVAQGGPPALGDGAIVNHTASDHIRAAWPARVDSR